MQLIAKLSILADASNYDSSCASSGVKGRNSIGGKGMGSSEGMGICHSYRRTDAVSRCSRCC